MPVLYSYAKKQKKKESEKNQTELILIERKPIRFGSVRSSVSDLIKTQAEPPRCHPYLGLPNNFSECSKPFTSPEIV